MNSLLRLVFVLALVFHLGSCQKFSGKRRVDFAPFAEQTIASLSSLDADLGRRRRVLTVRYMQEQGEYMEEHLRPLIVRLESIERHMIEYSIVVGQLSREGKPEEEQIAEIAEFFHNFRTTLESRDPEDGFISPEELDTIVEDIRSQEKTLEALAAAQPLVNNVALVAARVSSQLRGYIDELEEIINARIESDFAGLLSYADDYMVQRDLLLGALEEVYRHRGGDAEALQRLRASGAISQAHLGTMELEDPLGDIALEEHLLARFRRLKEVADFLYPELAEYAALQEEWDGITQSFDEDLREIWGVIFVWTRAHDRMARGIVDPAEWFDLSDTPAALFKIAQKSVF